MVRESKNSEELDEKTNVLHVVDDNNQLVRSTFYKKFNKNHFI